MDKTFDRILESVKSERRVRRVVVAGSHFDHAMEAIVLGIKDKLVTPIFCGEEKKTIELLEQYGGGDAKYTLYPCDTKEEAAMRAIRCILDGEADFIMKGQMDTSDIMGPALKRENGLRTEASIVNALGFAEIETHHKMLAMTDGSICVAPDVSQKRWMIQNSVDAMRKMGWECPYVACLAAIEKVNPKIQATVDGAELQKMNEEGLISGCIVEGPMAFDCAIDHRSVGSGARNRSYARPRLSAAQRVKRGQCRQGGRHK